MYDGLRLWCIYYTEKNGSSGHAYVFAETSQDALDYAKQAELDCYFIQDAYVHEGEFFN